MVQRYVLGVDFDSGFLVVVSPLKSNSPFTMSAGGAPDPKGGALRLRLPGASPGGGLPPRYPGDPSRGGAGKEASREASGTPAGTRRNSGAPEPLPGNRGAPARGVDVKPLARDRPPGLSRPGRAPPPRGRGSPGSPDPRIRGSGPRAPGDRGSLVPRALEGVPHPPGGGP